MLGTGRPFLLWGGTHLLTRQLLHPACQRWAVALGASGPAQSRVPQTPIPRGQQSWVCPPSSHYLLHPSAWTPVGPKRALALGPLHLLRPALSAHLLPISGLC